MRLLHIASALSSVSLALAWTTYVVPYSSGKDDTPALTAALSANPKLATNTTILFQQGVSYNILTPINFPRFENVIVSVQGNLSYAADIKGTQAIVASSYYPGKWFQFSGGSNVTLEGSQDPHWGWVNSHGQQWWDAMQTTASQVNRPDGWGFQSITNGEIRYMKLWQPVAAAFSVSGSNVYVHNNTILAISQSKAAPSNTDGFDVQGTNILLENNIVYNGDDCLAVGNSANNIHFRNSYCNGGHGLSIGSLGGGGAVANVQNVLIENVVMENSTYGARFKSWAGGKGTAKNVTWKGIMLKNVETPIYVTQNYWDKHASSKLNSASTSNTLIDTFTFQDFQGTIDDDPKNHEVIILDVHPGTAKSILAKNIHVTTRTGAPATVQCNSTAISTDVGFKCWNGLFQPTAAGE